MAMTIKKTNSTKTKTTSEIDLFESITLTKAKKKEVANDIGELLVDEILSAVGSSKSPISGAGWPGLSKDYKKFKEKKRRPGTANMEFTGDMLDSLTYKVDGEGNLEIGVFGKDAGKADGHNNFSGESSLPTRQFLPDQDKGFKQTIKSSITSIINEAIADSIPVSTSKLQTISSKTGFFTVMREAFPGSSKSQIVNAILSNRPFVEQLRLLGLFRFVQDAV